MYIIHSTKLNKLNRKQQEGSEEAEESNNEWGDGSWIFRAMIMFTLQHFKKKIVVYYNMYILETKTHNTHCQIKKKERLL